MKYGIQGGPGSFNDSALKDYIKRHNVQDFEVVYLFTTEKVLTAIEQGDIDFGQFAIHNAAGGMVHETLEAVSKHDFQIVEEFGILITHNLMKLPSVPVEDIHVVMAHDQVLAQCREHLAAKYPQLEQRVGEGDLIDTATAAKALADGKVDKHTFILGNPIIADICGLETVDRDLQDLKNNVTTFLMVKKRND